MYVAPVSEKGKYSFSQTNKNMNNICTTDLLQIVIGIIFVRYYIILQRAKAFETVVSNFNTHINFHLDIKIRLNLNLKYQILLHLYQWRSGEKKAVITLVKFCRKSRYIAGTAGTGDMSKACQL